MKKYLKIILFLAFIICCFSKAAVAVPAIQLYIEGAIFDEADETWVTTTSNFSLQVIGANHDIYDIDLAMAIPEDEFGLGSITIGETILDTFTYGTPIRGDGTALPGHGIYPTYYGTYYVGNFAPQYTVYDMTPGQTGEASGEIKTYGVSVSGYSWVHFDAYDYIYVNDKHAKYVFDPFSHDAEYTPEPATMLLLGSGLLGLAALGRKRS